MRNKLSSKKKRNRDSESRKLFSMTHFFIGSL